MERAEAEKVRDRMAAEHPDRDTHSFILSERNGEWTVAKVAVPPAAAVDGEPEAPSPTALHDHDAGRLPGGLPPWSAG